MTQGSVTGFTPVSELHDTYDCIIVGSGAAGLSAALQARELGLEPVVLEKMGGAGGNSRRASSGMNAAETHAQLKRHIVDSYADFFADTFAGGGRRNNVDLLRYFTSHAALAIAWLADYGIHLDDLTITGGMRTKRTHRPDSMAPIGAFLVSALLSQVRRAAVPICVNVRVTALLRGEGGVTGVEAVGPDEHRRTIHAGAVILATGGFGASRALLGRYRPDLLHYHTTNQPGTTGDGIRLAHSVGADLVDMDQVQVHPTVQQDTDHPFLIGEACRGEGAILVDGNGRRFVNELDTRRHVTAAIDRLPTKSAFLIFDSAIRNQVKAVEFYDHIGLVIHGDAVSDLARKIRVDPARLDATVRTWNDQVDRHLDADFGRSTGMERAIRSRPFFAIHVAPAVHYTMGGVRINSEAQVLSSEGVPIPGLFAGGEVTGGLHGNNRIGGNSITEAVVFGRQAAQQASVHIGRAGS